ncbi:MAG: phosphodiester glycosidase family protein [Planctomycetota bacterium]|nr:phosphodiester glycosidase family protein [Planctomycetota bacterium]
MRTPRLALAAVLAVALALVAACGLGAAEKVSQPFVGVTHIDRTETAPRPLRIHIIKIDLAAPGLRFRVTPQGGPQDTVKQTTRQFLALQRAQIAVNAHYFEPWPPPDPDPGAADLVGLAASDGNVYSPFDAKPPKPYAIRIDAPALNIDAANHASIVHRNPSDPTGRTVAEPVTLYNAVAGNEQIVTASANTAGQGKWHNTLNPHTAIGLAPGRTLIIFTVDGRQPGTSEGMTSAEVADLLRRDYGVTDALSLDGGGSTTLCIAEPEPRVVNVPSGSENKPAAERPVGSNLAIFAAPLPRPGGGSPAR